MDSQAAGKTLRAFACLVLLAAGAAMASRSIAVDSREHRRSTPLSGEEVRRSLSSTASPAKSATKSKSAPASKGKSRNAVDKASKGSAKPVKSR